MRKNKVFFVALSICGIFFVLYSILALVKHAHFQTGYDLAIVDQVVWKYNQLKLPITTVHAYYLTSSLADHVEIIYALLSPFYFFLNDAITILVLQTFAITTSAIPIFLLAQKNKLKTSISLSLTISYLLFYGIQQAIWADVHSLVFGVSFLAWFIYFLYTDKKFLSYLFFFLAIFCKEDIALLTLVISSIHFFVGRKKQDLVFTFLSATYIVMIFGVYFPHFTRDGYRYASSRGIFADLNVTYMFDTLEKRQVILYSFLWFGFLPLLAPLYLLVALSDLFHYFVLGHAVVSSAQGLFLHYRSSLSLFLAWPTIIAISKYKKLNNMLVAVYILICALFLQYYLHLPLSYLTKKWFWTKPQSVSSIEKIITALPPQASVVSQVNILPHIAHRDYAFTLWPEERKFSTNSPCGKDICAWFRWGGNPKYLLVDLSTDWDIRHVLTNHEQFVEGIQNMESVKMIIPIKEIGTSRLYRINKSI